MCSVSSCSALALKLPSCLEGDMLPARLPLSRVDVELRVSEKGSGTGRIPLPEVLGSFSSPTFVGAFSWFAVSIWDMSARSLLLTIELALYLSLYVLCSFFSCTVYSASLSKRALSSFTLCCVPSFSFEAFSIAARSVAIWASACEQRSCISLRISDWRVSMSFWAMCLDSRDSRREASSSKACVISSRECLVLASSSSLSILWAAALSESPVACFSL
mmetsp:Transcript_12398/g.30390  ORF Transcript_12398/g.30390 Transcript_12398/m.30390 type:complete len:218 (-) Transcript_12398:139-792(-)